LRTIAIISAGSDCPVKARRSMHIS
jgi:hypothetical protein